MTRFKGIMLTGIILATVFLSSGNLWAQPAFNPGPAFGPGGQMGPVNNGPTISPYINLLRGGNPAYQNYFGLVQPQQNAMSQISGLQQQQQQGFTSSNSVITDLNAELPTLVTGRRSGFQTSYRYFQNQYFLTGGGGYGASAYGGASGLGMMNRGGMGMGMGMGAGGMGMGMGAGGMGMGNQQFGNPMLQPGSGMNVPVTPAPARGVGGR